MMKATQQLRTKEYMTYPIFSADNKILLFNLQVISRMKSGGKYPLGFSMIDELFITLAGNLLKPKLLQIMSERNMKALQKEVVSTIGIASYMTTQRSYSDFIRVCNELLTGFFNFEAVGVLFRD